MRRRSWEEKGGDDDLDQPVTLTEKQLRSLERKAGLGLFGLILAFVALGVAGWTMYRALTTPTQAQPIAATPAPAAADTAAAQPAATAPTPAPTTPAPTTPASAGVASAPVGGPAAVIPTARTHSVKASNAVARRGSHSARTASSAPAPKMESFEPAPAPGTSLPTPTPTPVPVEHKAAPADTSHH
jgi:cytoskeletal protein RodZ